MHSNPKSEGVPLHDALIPSVRRRFHEQQRRSSSKPQRVVHRNFEPLENVNRTAATAKCVVDGFTRNELEPFDLNSSSSSTSMRRIKALCLRYYDESTWWDIDSALLEEMKGAPNGRPYFNEWTACNR